MFKWVTYIYSYLIYYTVIRTGYILFVLTIYVFIIKIEEFMYQLILGWHDFKSLLAVRDSIWIKEGLQTKSQQSISIRSKHEFILFLRRIVHPSFSCSWSNTIEKKMNSICKASCVPVYTEWPERKVLIRSMFNVSRRRSCLQSNPRLLFSHEATYWCEKASNKNVLKKLCMKTSKLCFAHTPACSGAEPDKTFSRQHNQIVWIDERKYTVGTCQIQ